MKDDAALARQEIFRDRVFAALLLLLGVAGLLDIRFGAWRPGPGVGNHLAPMAAYWTLIAAGAVMLLGRGRKKAGTGDLLKLAPIPVLFGLAWAGGYFLAVIHIGVATSTALFLALAFWLLSARTEIRLFNIATAALGAGATFWLLFTRLAPILLSNPLLF